MACRKRIILCFCCLILGKGQAFGLPVFANSKYTQSFNNNTSIFPARSFLQPKEKSAINRISVGGSVFIPDDTNNCTKNHLTINVSSLFLDDDKGTQLRTPKTNIDIANGAAVFL